MSAIYYEDTYRVDSRAADLFGQCRPSSLLGFLQEAGTRAAIQLHVSREEMIARYHVFWMMARLWYRLEKPLVWDDLITVRTWHRGAKGASMYRDFDLYRDGEYVGEAVNLWVLADVDTHRLSQLSKISEFQGTTGEALCKDRVLGKLHMPDDLNPAAERRIHYSDTDVNGHVNNVRYADFSCDALHMQRLGAGRFVSSLQIGYLKECKPGETIKLSTGCAGDQWYVSGDGSEGKTRFHAALTLSPLDNPVIGA